jgi:hypothetical protein
MRMLLRATMDTEKSTELLQSGRMQETLQIAMDRMQPEASYFYTDDGRRTALFIFDMQDSSQLPPVGEPFLTEGGATLYVTPVMNQDDLQKGLQQAFG